MTAGSLFGGRVDFASEDHEETMLALGYQSEREITRTRVSTAMAAQTREQGRYLGGHPPYGYRLADTGPHPNKGPRRVGAAGAPAETGSRDGASSSLPASRSPLSGPRRSAWSTS